MQSWNPKTGTLRPVTRWKIIVPTPAVNKATAGFRPVKQVPEQWHQTWLAHVEYLIARA